MPCLQTAKRVTVSVEAPKNAILPIMRRVLRLESLCMSIPHLKGTDYTRHSWLGDGRLSSPWDLGSSKRNLSRLYRLTRCIRPSLKREGLQMLKLMNLNLYEQVYYDIYLPIHEYHPLHACVFVLDGEKLNLSSLATNPRDKILDVDDKSGTRSKFQINLVATACLKSSSTSRSICRRPGINYCIQFQSKGTSPRIV